MICVEGASEFKGYDSLELNGKLTALFIDGKAVDVVTAGQEAVVILDQTPFYAESGGQVGTIKVNLDVHRFLLPGQRRTEIWSGHRPHR